MDWLIGPVWIVDISLRSDGHDMAIWRCVRDHLERIESSDKILAGGVVGVTISGHGVVRKPASSELAARIRTDSETFTWSEHNGILYFVRSERLSPILAQLTDTRLVPQRILVGFSPAEAARKVTDLLGWKSLLRPTIEGSALAQAVVRRIKLPLLGLMLAMLSINAFFTPRLAMRRQELYATLATHEKLLEKSESNDDRLQALCSDFSTRETPSLAAVCDGIAAALPKAVILTRMEVNPLEKRFVAGQPLQVRNRVVVLSGIATTSSEVTQFIDALWAGIDVVSVQLTTLKQERVGNCLSFNINIRL